MNKRNNPIGLVVFYILTIPAMLYVISIILRLQDHTKFVLDIYGLKLIEPISSNFISDTFKLITLLGSKWGIIGLLFCALIWLWRAKKDYFGMLLLVFSVLIGNEINKWLKDFYQRERPLIDPTIGAEGFSFPSGHAMVGIIFYGLLAYFILKELNSKKMKIFVVILFSLLVFLIGFSRIILQAHFPTDVFAGFSLGFCFLALSIFIYEWRIKLILKRVEKNTTPI